MNLSFRNRTDALVEAWRNAGKGLLIDVREPDEYRTGHIPGSRNIPLGRISDADLDLDDPADPILLYCLTGMRASRAVALLKRMGYEGARCIGGIRSYHGSLES